MGRPPVCSSTADAAASGLLKSDFGDRLGRFHTHTPILKILEIKARVLCDKTGLLTLLLRDTWKFPRGSTCEGFSAQASAQVVLC